MSDGIGGFRNAPFTQAVLLASVGSSLLTQTAKIAARRKVPAVVHLLSRSLAFHNPADLVFGAFLLYHFRLLERQAGSAKFSAHAVAVTGISLALQVALTRVPPLLLGSSLSIGGTPVGQLASGPYALLFACFVQYFFDVPATSKFSLFGWTLSNKSFVYLAGGQLLCHGWSSLLAGVTGAAAGLLYRANVLGIKRLRFPRAITHLFSSGTSVPQVLQPGGPFHQQQPPAPHQHGRHGSNHQSRSRSGRPRSAAAGGTVPALAGLSPEQRAQVLAATRGGLGALEGDVAAAAAASAPPPPPPSEDSIAQLEAMGFGRLAAIQALQQSGDDLQDAIAMLLS